MNCPFTDSQANRQRFVAELMEFLRFPSVSAQPKQSEAIKKCAAWLANHLRKIGLQDVQVISTPRHPPAQFLPWYYDQHPISGRNGEGEKRDT